MEQTKFIIQSQPRNPYDKRPQLETTVSQDELAEAEQESKASHQELHEIFFGDCKKHRLSTRTHRLAKEFDLKLVDLDLSFDLPLKVPRSLKTDIEDRELLDPFLSNYGRKRPHLSNDTYRHDIQFKRDFKVQDTQINGLNQQSTDLMAIVPKSVPQEPPSTKPSRYDISLDLD